VFPTSSFREADKKDHSSRKGARMRKKEEDLDFMLEEQRFEVSD
jgi:hypothetical protein